LSFRVSLVKMPLLSAFSNSGGTMTARNALILQLTHDGKAAFSECVADETPSCTLEDNATALRFIKARGAGIRGEPPAPEEFLEAAKGVKGNQMAKAAIEMLLWDYRAKVEGLPLDEELGESKGFAEAGIAIGLARKGEVMSRIEDSLERGYKRVKVKIDRKGALETLRGVRDEFPEIPLSADANGCFELRRDHSTLKRIDRFGLQYLEQPLGFGDLGDHSRLALDISTPICLDESVTTLKRAEEALETGAASVINVKPGRVGGLSVAIEIAELARARRAHVWVGGMLETGIGRAFNVALASQKLVDYPGDTSPNDRYFRRDLVKNPFVLKSGKVRPNPGAGIGVELDPAFFARATQKSWSIF